MKKQIFFLTVLAFLYNITYAQQPNTIAKVLPMEMFVNTMALGVEQRILKEYTLQITGGISQASKFGYYDARDLKGGFGELQLRKYGFLEENNTGDLYVGMYAGYRYAEYTKELTYYIHPVYVRQEYKEIGEYIGTGFFVGYQLNIAKNKLFLDTYLGAGMRWGRTTNKKSLDPNAQDVYINDNGSNGTLLSMNYTGISPKIGILLGIKL